MGMDQVHKESLEERSSVIENVEPVSTQRLISAAIEAFSERGFYGTTTRDIATRADLSPAAIYMRHRSKADLLYLIMRETHEELLCAMDKALAGVDNPEERLDTLVKVHVTFHAEKHTAARVANHELPALGIDQRAEIRKLRRQIERLVDETLAAGTKTGVFTVSDVRATTFLILSMGIGVSRWFRPDGRLSPEELGEVYAGLVARMVAP
jgi:AcrR family transcriptional regulator